MIAESSLNDFYRAYAQLVIRTGINLEPDHPVLISTGWETYTFAVQISEEAYRQGASQVKIEVRDERLTAQRLKFAPASSWALTPPGLAEEYQGYVDQGWSRVALEDLAASEILEGANPDGLRVLRQARNRLTRSYQAAQMSDRFPWVVVAAPSPSWMKKLGLSETELVKLLEPLLLLNTPDPQAAWDAKMRAIERRCQRLNNLSLKELRYRGPGTDLSIGLRPEHRWVGGASEIHGRPFLCNIPTEEVFSAPDAFAVNGRVALTKPVTVLGALVQGGWLVFKDGKVVDSGAQRNAENLKRYFEIDEGASRLGEVALVDENSPIALSGRLFGSSLYDENAACHIALGAAYPICYADPDHLVTDEAKRTQGCNTSAVHTDVMIGSPQIDVDGITAQGESVPLLRQGCFTAELR